MKPNFDKQPTPRSYKHNGSRCYLDPIRQKFIVATPEEKVRQKVITYLINNLKAPKDMICVEEHLAHYGDVDTLDRADITIDRYDYKDGCQTSFVIIECKAASVYLGEKQKNQLFRYADHIGGEYFMLTNGDETFCYKYQRGKFVEIDHLPKYKDMLQGRYLPAKKNKQRTRAKFDKLGYRVPVYVREFHIGEDTEKAKAVPMVNFYDCLMDCRHKMPARKYGMFRLLEDVGIRELSVGNGSGGSFYGKHRSFLIEVDGNTEFVSILITEVETSSGRTGTRINVAIEADAIHNALELNIDKYLDIESDKCTFNHNGAIAVGIIGSGKIEGLRKMISKEYPRIIKNDKICLGQLTNDRLWHMDDKEVINFTRNLITYALIRDEYRDKIKKRSAR